MGSCCSPSGSARWSESSSICWGSTCRLAGRFCWRPTYSSCVRCRPRSGAGPTPLRRPPFWAVSLDSDRISSRFSFVKPLRIRPAAPADGDLIFALVRELAEYERLSHTVDATPDLIAAALFGPHPRLFCHIVEWDATPPGFPLGFYNFSPLPDRPLLF